MPYQTPAGLVVESALPAACPSCGEPLDGGPETVMLEEYAISRGTLATEAVPGRPHDFLEPIGAYRDVSRVYRCMTCLAVLHREG